MKVTDSLLALALALAPFTATAYQTAQNIEEAKTKVTDDGIAVVMYARDWDKYSKKTAELMLADPAVTKALGQAVVIRMDVPNVTTKEEHEENKKRFGNLDLSFPNVYPGPALRAERLIGIICTGRILSLLGRGHSEERELGNAGAGLGAGDGEAQLVRGNRLFQPAHDLIANGVALAATQIELRLYLPGISRSYNRFPLAIHPGFHLECFDSLA